MTVATLFIDLQADFFSSHPRLIQNRSQLTAKVNGLAGISRRSGSHIFWIKQRWWRTVNLPISGIYQEAKRGSLRLTGMARMIERAAFVFFGAMVVSWLIMHHWL